MSAVAHIVEPEARALMGGREPPHDDLAESCLVGAMLIGEGNALTDEILSTVPPMAYYDPKCKIAHEAVAWLRENQRPVDLLSVLARLSDIGRDRQVGGADGLVAMVNAVPTATPENVLGYAKRVVDLADVRKVLALCQKTEAAILAGKAGAARDLKESFEAETFEVCQSAELGGPERIKSVASRQLKEFMNPTGEDVTSSGFVQYDRLTRGGLRRKNFTIVAGQTSMGKTAWALNVAHRVAKQGHGVLFVSLEMTKAELFQRLACSHGDVSSTRIDERAQFPLSEEEQRRFLRGIKEVGFLPFDIVDDPGQTIASVRAHGRRSISGFARDKGPDGRPRRLALVVIDYLQMLKATSTKKDRPREQEVAEVSRNCKGLAKYLDCHVMALSQLNDDAAKRKDTEKRPKLGDLRESKAMAHDADLVTFVWRGDYENERDAKGHGPPPDLGDAEIIIAKQRGGRSGGAAKMTFDKGRQRFEDAYDDNSPPPPRETPPKDWHDDE